MDLPWKSDASSVFINNVGLITSDGPMGPDIMACEWTHHISYEPGLIAICVDITNTTHANVSESKEFGVSLAATDQNVLSSIAGGSHGKDVDKMKVLMELGFKFYQAKTIKVLMVEGAALSLECKAIEIKPHGDHVMFIGEVQEMKLNPDKHPLAYHQGKYWKLGEQILKPAQEELDRIKTVVDQHRISGTRN